MNTRRGMIVVAALAAWLLPPGAATAQTTLRYQFKQGDHLRFVREQNMKMTRKIMGTVADVTVDQQAELAWTIQSVDGQGNAVVAIKFGHSKTTMDGPMGMTVVDSKSEEPPDDPTGKVLHKVVRGLAGLEVNGAISSLGEFSDVKVPEKALKELRNMPGSDAFDDLLSADGLKRMVSQNALILPKQSVSPGSSWKSGKIEFKLPFGKSIVAEECTYGGTVTRGGRALEKISLKQQATLEPNPKLEFTVKLKSHEGAGTAWLDNAVGRLLETTLLESTEREFDLNGVAVNEKITQKTTLRWVR